MKLYWLRVGALAIGVVAIAHCQIQNAAGASSPTSSKAERKAGQLAQAPAFQQRNPRYQLRRGDTFELDFAFSPEFNQTIAVQPDGYITLKSVGSMHIEGETIPELIDTIRKAYTGVLHEPVITVALKDFEKPYFIVSGQVGKPGKYDLRSDTTVTEAVAIAGGFTEASKHSQVVLFRPAFDGMMEARVLDVKKMFNSRDLKEDVPLQPGDLVFVPQNKMSKIRKFVPTSSVGMYLNSTNF